MKNIKPILIAFLVGITIFSVFKYVVILKERYDLGHALEIEKTRAINLESDKQNLLQGLEKEKGLKQQLNEENAGFREKLKVERERLIDLSMAFAKSHNKIERLSSEIAALKAETTALREEKDSLNTQLTLINQERETLQARLNSIAELKKAIKELKRQMHKVGVQIQRKADVEATTEGNRGFVIKDGKATSSPAKVRIEVTPVLKNEQ